MKAGVTCPACKSGKLKNFHSTKMMVIMTCTKCDKTMTIKSKAGELSELIIPGVAVLTGSIAVLNFFGIHNAEELLDLFDV